MSTKTEPSHGIRMAAGIHEPLATMWVARLFLSWYQWYPWLGILVEGKPKEIRFALLRGGGGVLKEDTPNSDWNWLVLKDLEK